MKVLKLISWIQCGALLGVSCAISPLAIAADSPLMTAPVVPDPVLAQMVGRGELAGQIVFFGVTMSSSWQTPSGPINGSLSAALHLAGSGPNFIPTITIVSTQPTDPSAQLNTPENASIAQTVPNVSGAEETIQVAGSNNSVSNHTTLNVEKYNPATMGSNAASQQSPVNLQNSPNVTYNVTNGLNMQVIDGASRVSEGLVPSGIQQIVQLAANNTTITNTMALTVGTQLAHNSAALANQNLANIGQILASVRGISSIP